MQIFQCSCGATVFFENTSCLKCGRALGYLPDHCEMATIEPVEGSEVFTAQTVEADRGRWRRCENYAKEDVCNWMIPESDAEPLCVACRLNQTIPDLSSPDNKLYWSRIETAKRRLVYSLLKLKLPVVSKAADPEKGVAFAFLADPPAEGAAPKVLTGHADGLITLNIAEADEVEREQARRNMHEAYRTLLGHFRHEIGHYYWDRLIRDSPWIEPFRKLFGDEQADYQESLSRHYAQGAPADWQDRFISQYASSHPWEDWAETWAHYLHMIDTLETSGEFGITARHAADDMIDRQLFGAEDYGRKAPAATAAFARILREWVWLSLAMNSINRAMGTRDVYPFVLNASVARKLKFVHDVVRAQAAAVVS